MPMQDIQDWVSNFYRNKGFPKLFKSIDGCLEKGKVKGFEAVVQSQRKVDNTEIHADFWEVVCKIDIKGRKDELSDDEDDAITDLLYIDVHGSESRFVNANLEGSGFSADQYEGLKIEINHV